MRKLFVIAASCCLVVAAAACSSSSKPSAQSTTTVSIAPADAATCAAYTKFEAGVKNVGSSPADFKALATTLRSTATAITASPPASLASSAQSFAGELNAAASTLSTATSRSQALPAVAAFIFAGSNKSKPYVTWWTTACKK